MGEESRESGRAEVDESDDGVSTASDLLSFKSDGDMGPTIAGIDDVEGGVAEASDDKKRLSDGWIRKDSRKKLGNFVYAHSESGTRSGKRPTLSTERGLIEMWMKKRRKSDRGEADESGEGFTAPSVPTAAEVHADRASLQQSMLEKAIQAIDNGRGRFESNMVAGDSDSDSMGGYSEDPSVASKDADADQARQEAMLDNDSDSIDDSRGRLESNMVSGDSDSDSMGGYSEDPSAASEDADADQASRPRRTEGTGVIGPQGQGRASSSGHLSGSTCPPT